MSSGINEMFFTYFLCTDFGNRVHILLTEENWGVADWVATFSIVHFLIRENYM